MAFEQPDHNERRSHGGARIAASATVTGTIDIAPGAYLAQGTAVRAAGASAVSIGAGSALLETGVIVGRTDMPARIGRRTVFGHLARVIGAEVGDLCEIGNATIIMPGAQLGTRVFTGEGTLIPEGIRVPDNAVVVGRPGRAIRTASEADIARLTALRGGDLTLPDAPAEPYREPIPARQTTEPIMAQIYRYKDKTPEIAASATLFDSAEITGDVTIGERSIIGAGVRIVGDSHGPVRIGADVQILENAVLHLLPDNTLVLADGVVIGPGAMIHGCRVGAGTVVEPAAIVCDNAAIGAHCLVKAGALVRQGAEFGDNLVLEGFPAREAGRHDPSDTLPAWAIRPGDLGTLALA
ncbi:MAG: UDP-3-O-(3-hydroxymyristoyl) glucosamine N-acyltransferase [Alphaproteobacteria bacterium]|nr:UDP-3-O-(3-hydroxymyristoyl) glucosamine N-acyltransferase [Alphaproteobacteria bacterium]